MQDLISRSALLELAHNHVGGTVDCNDIARFPAVDAEVVRHGRWIVKCETHGDPYDDGQWEEWMALCSERGRIICLDDFECAKGNVGKEIAKFPYCHCGAKMRGDMNAAD